MRTDFDRDLDGWDKAALAAEVRRLRAGIRAHRDATGHELCWHHPKLWALLPEPVDPRIEVPEWPQFFRGCIAYRQSLDRQAPDAPRSQSEFHSDEGPKAGQRAEGLAGLDHRRI